MPAHIPLGEIVLGLPLAEVYWPVKLPLPADMANEDDADGENDMTGTEDIPALDIAGAL